jgi:hypothetical protein
MNNNILHRCILLTVLLLGAAAPAAARDHGEKRASWSSLDGKLLHHEHPFGAGARGYHAASVPELDPSGAASAVALLACCAFVVAARRKAGSPG